MVALRHQKKLVLLPVIACSILLTSGYSAGAEGLTNRDMNDKESAKNANIATAEKLNGNSDDAKKKDKQGTCAKQSTEADPKTKASPTDTNKLGGESALTDTKNKQDAKKTANVVNQVPGVQVSQKDLEPPTAPPIKGFHPIKKLLAPIENLEGMSVKLEQQIMKLEGPIAGLQPPMISLQKKMTGVDQQIGSMQNRLGSMQGEVIGVRSDLAVMRKDIEGLKQPIVELRKPIGTVAAPLEGLQRQLNFILMAIFVASGAIAFGTPIAAVLIYRSRHRLFPDMKEHDLPKVQAPPPPAASGRR